MAWRAQRLALEVKHAPQVRRYCADIALTTNTQWQPTYNTPTPFDC
jgi:hypothetical protein